MQTAAVNAACKLLSNAAAAAATDAAFCLRCITQAELQPRPYTVVVGYGPNACAKFIVPRLG